MQWALNASNDYFSEEFAFWHTDEKTTTYICGFEDEILGFYTFDFYFCRVKKCNWY